MESENLSRVENILKNGGLSTPDIVIVVIYFLALIGVGFLASRATRRGSVSGFFLASRNMNWMLVGGSLFSSNVGSEHLIGLAGSGAASGIAIATYEMNAIFILMLLGWFFVPVYLASGIYTMPEYLRLRFGGQRIRTVLSIFTLFLYIFTKISGEEGLYISIIVLLLLAGCFSIGGGLTAVIWTDFFQTILMVCGAFIVMSFAMVEVGGYDAMLTKYAVAEADAEYSAFYQVNGTNKSCKPIQDDFMHMLRSADAPGEDLPWTGLFTGMLIGSVWYWCTDQVIVQRTLSAKNLTHAKGGVLLAGILKFLPLFLLVIPGMAARVLYRNEIGCSDPTACQKICQSESGCTDIAFVLLVLDLLPSGLRGLIMAVMMAAIMSSLTSVFNSASTIFTIDIWTRFRLKATDTEKLIVGRSFVVVLIAVSIAWIPIIVNYKQSQLFHYVQAVSNFLCPPITAIFLLGLFWPRLNEQGAFWSLIIGFAVGIVRFGLQFGYKGPACGSGLQDTRPEFVIATVDRFHYLHFGAFSFLLVGVISTIISLLTEPIPQARLYRLTYWTRFSKEIREELEDDNTDFNIQPETRLEPSESSLTIWRRILNCICGLNQVFLSRSWNNPLFII
ncbi:sodium/glucose cotransporter 4 isoform X2 [Eurytemora carolleeae]|uniref:sodium/glucose cotransporter 4 isoform X2 n=1 Tax=Eurytemora carolleeae TaxID=1294199 RepID=UPI000C76D32A|nr:sodium/glucose cotransporter 4 isoform X2 [Eurytemora carolleeae]|eukprot:XP_023334925.1 sodium/glucose cotransporter 4-like isoform X2 [Eurytemora affinis]